MGSSIIYSKLKKQNHKREEKAIFIDTCIPSTKKKKDRKKAQVMEKMGHTLLDGREVNPKGNPTNCTLGN